MARKIVIIGGVATGPKAAARARRLDPEAEITLVEQGSFLSYAGCGMPYYIAGVVKEMEELMCTPAGVVRDAAYFKGIKGINVLTRTRALSIDRQAKEVRVMNLETGEVKTLPYDKLILATGSTPVRPPIPGLDLGRVYTLGNLEEAAAIRDALASGRVEKVVIIGGGLIGLEVADALKTAAQTYGREFKITLMEALPQLVSAQLDADMAALLAKHLRTQGVDLRLSCKVLRLEGDEEGKVKAVITEEDMVPTDMVIVATGVRPNTALAQVAGLRLGTSGGIIVNEYLETDDPDILAGGDCVENIHVLNGKPIYLPLGSTANRHGRVLGANVTGGREKFPGVLGTAIFKAFDYNVGRTGFSEKEARASGYKVETIICPNPDRAHYYPGSKPIIIKMVADKATRKLLGVQIVGPGEVAKRVDVAATAITLGATIDQVANLDLAYAPPYSTALDPLTHAANALRNKLDGLAQSLNPLEVKERLERGEDLLLLDVRTPAEVEEIRLPYPQVRHIPLGKLRQEAASLPRDRDIIAFCKISLRGYEAELILKSLGFTRVFFMEGGLAAWPFEVVKGK
ncbi:NADPH-dependent 2,4-dienoyl-CoA reductase, sulfur reductase [Thermanaeromonas toyohensis ToBE]|uniref:NADPH-dependent 2,4-dienoyl-CoA reductase, sulfur reductase n=1 Tax=Thermanaeromonas toyohensis ToBE TaxID=698762 RepID=A0A1W1W3H1_9FIRM|nr:FAD-dependent oxidoreductase [Thermanaeromonas toyohensis]SMB99634.1 NADPH-dependent 2,4-dienoyl-CoA reductase, sulfur reductase [Thermanaeromonas toyohensis ToBE]